MKCPVYGLSYILTAKQAAIYKPTVKLLSLKWTPHRDELLFRCLSTERTLRNPVTLFPAHSAHQLAAEHMSGRTDRWKINNTASRFVQTLIQWLLYRK